MFFLTVMTPDLVDEDINHPEKRCPRRLIKKQPSDWLTGTSTIRKNDVPVV